MDVLLELFDHAGEHAPFRVRIPVGQRDEIPRLYGSSQRDAAPKAELVSIAPPGAITTEYGDGASRATAYYAFTGKRAPVALVMTRYTIEGQPIYSSIQTQMGVAVFTVDGRKDGGTVRTDTLKSLAFVRYVPGRIVNGVEVEKERLEVADPAMIEKGVVYILVEPACLTGPCTRVF